MRFPWANTALFVLLIFQLLTGFTGLIGGSENLRWLLWLHGIGGYTVALILFWKGVIILDVLNRIRRFDFSRLAFLFLTALLLLILFSALVWIYAGRIILFGYSLMTIHALASLALLALLVWHTLSKRFILRVPRALDRRAFLRFAGVSLAGFFIARFAEPVLAALELPGASRRFTGSYEWTNFTGEFPQVIWLSDHVPLINPNAWRLVVVGLVEHPLTLTIDDLARISNDSVIETIDCTGGWYSTQEWSGVNLTHLLDLVGVQANARNIEIQAASGYGRKFSLDEARGFMLATRVAGQPLTPGHGFPLRLVARGHRGFEWIKWVARVRVEETSHLFQSPVPLQ